MENHLDEIKEMNRKFATLSRLILASPFSLFLFVFQITSNMEILTE